MPITPQPCPNCGRPILLLRIFADEVPVDAHRRCYRIVRDPATLRPLVQEVPSCYPEHECAHASPRARAPGEHEDHG